MQKIIVSDTSCLILLKKIGQLDLLKSLFGKIVITQEIFEEYNDILPEFIEIQNPSDTKYQHILENFLDRGEASAIALALEQEDCLLIIDELKGRKEARLLGLNITGTLGILILAKQNGLIQSFKSILLEIEKTNFRISKDILKKAIEIIRE